MTVATSGEREKRWGVARSELAIVGKRICSLGDFRPRNQFSVAWSDHANGDVIEWPHTTAHASIAAVMNHCGGCGVASRGALGHDWGWCGREGAAGVPFRGLGALMINSGARHVTARCSGRRQPACQIQAQRGRCDASSIPTWRTVFRPGSAGAKTGVQV